MLDPPPSSSSDPANSDLKSAWDPGHIRFEQASSCQSYPFNRLTALISIAELLSRYRVTIFCLYRAVFWLKRFVHIELKPHLLAFFDFEFMRNQQVGCAQSRHSAGIRASIHHDRNLAKVFHAGRDGSSAANIKTYTNFSSPLECVRSIDLNYMRSDRFPNGPSRSCRANRT